MAGGKGTRLRPMLAPGINKHLCPVGGKPMIHWPMQTLKDMGVEDVVVVLSGHNLQLLMNYIQSQKNFGMNVCYTYGGENPRAVGKQLLDAERVINGERFILMLADSIYLEPLSMPNLKEMTGDFIWAMKRDEDWDDMSKYAKHPTSQVTLVQTGAWIFTPRIFHTMHALEGMKNIRIRTLVEKMARDRKKKFEYEVVPDRSFIDCGTPDAVRKADALLLG